jgi:hypothetical protein
VVITADGTVEQTTENRLLSLCVVVELCKRYQENEEAISVLVVLVSVNKLANITEHPESPPFHIFRLRLRS